MVLLVHGASCQHDLVPVARCSKQIRFGIMSPADIIKNGELQAFETKLYEASFDGSATESGCATAAQACAGKLFVCQV